MTTPSSPSKLKRWIISFSSVAFRLVFFNLIFLQIPLFRVPCRAGVCSSPIHVMSSQLVAVEKFPISAVKVLLYPGAFANAIVTNRSVPKWEDLLNIYNLTNVKEAPAMTDLLRLEVLAGSCFSVFGAAFGLFIPSKMTMSMFGTLLIVFGLVRESFAKKAVYGDPSKAVYIYPTMFIALICAASAVKYKAKKVTRSPPPRTIAKPLRSSTKSKLQ